VTAAGGGSGGGGAIGDVPMATTPGVTGARAHRPRSAGLPELLGSLAAGRWAWPATVVGLVALAGILRLHDLATRSTWDADQGHEMITLTAFVRDGVWPLLGPSTSSGDFHHGALYYYLLAPAAWLGGGDPAVVVGEIAVLGSIAVGLVAVLARSIAGATAGLVAGLVMAVSASAIDQSTFLWNPNVVSFTSALAVYGAWRAWSTMRMRWWLLAAAALAATTQAHVAGWILLLPFLVWLVADWRRRRGPDRRRLVWTALGGVGIGALSYVPLLLSELQTGFHELHAAVAYIASGGLGVDIAPVTRLTFVSLRVLSWPLTGLLADGLAAGFFASIVVVVLVAWRARSAEQPERAVFRWIGATMIWSCLVLGVGVAGLAYITPLPIDQYHVFLDPVIFVIVGAGAAALWRLGGTGEATAPAEVDEPARARNRLLIRAGVCAALALLIGWNVAHWPAALVADGGFPAAETAAQRIDASIGRRPTLVLSLPTYKSADAYVYPLTRIGASVNEQVEDPTTAVSIVVVCDSLFIPDCGGPAEDRAAAIAPATGLVDRFSAAPGRTISVYEAVERLAP
jgi:Dolichyl-phosphate-mannose-protein mannosyltransferase